MSEQILPPRQQTIMAEMREQQFSKEILVRERKALLRDLRPINQKIKQINERIAGLARQLSNGMEESNEK